MNHPRGQTHASVGVLRQLRACRRLDIGLVLVAGFCSLQIGLILALSLLHLARLV
jgi:hypothetical protein